ncbi:MAG: biotin--[acetyl-CoA-carboxylase] ligase [Phycisphaerales bacterium]|nr:biotin--[acetyl-CoA-carboxylase] ligase [Phycisphaerales bacterium]
MEHGRLNPEKVADALITTRIRRTITVLDEVDSTNRHVLDMPAGELDGAVVVAEKQSQGRGRRGNHWQCPAGAGLLCTVGLVDAVGAIDANLLSLVVPIALCEGVFNETGLRCEIKWPNDLVFRGRKLSGILIEAQTTGTGNIRYAVGFGINCLQHRGHFEESIRDRATSLDLESESPINREAILASVLNALDRRLTHSESWTPEQVCGEWRTLAAGLGGRCEVQENGQRISGNLIDIDPTAAIIMQLDEGGRRLFSAASTTVLSLSM